MAVEDCELLETPAPHPLHPQPHPTTQPDDNVPSSPTDQADAPCPLAGEADPAWSRLGRTLLLLLAFLGLGMTDCVRGPTLLDLSDLLAAPLSSVSLLILFSSAGSLVGCGVAGAGLDWAPRARYPALAACLAAMGLSNALLPHCPSLAWLYTAAALAGFTSGGLDTAGNVLLLDLWAGRDSGPAMHALHFTFGLGAALAPALARPFLTNQPAANYVPDNSTEKLITTVVSDNSTLLGYNSPWTIKTLYPIVGSYCLLLSFGFVYCFIVDMRRQDKIAAAAQKRKEEAGRLVGKSTSYLLVSLLALFFFLYVGMEVAFGTFLPVWAVQSSLKLSRQAGADLATLFWATFATGRGLAIIAAAVTRPVRTLRNLTPSPTKTVALK